MLDWLVHGVEWILGTLMGMIHQCIDLIGYWGVALLMAVESANVPLPSEMILPYAGYLVQQGQMSIHLAALAGAIGCVLGSIPSYWLGYVGGRPWLQKYGKWLLLSEHDLEKAERWTAKFGDWTFFLCRMLPVVRTFISFPAGVFKAPLVPFLFLTFVGSLVWSYALVWVGIKFGENLEAFKHIWHKFDAAIAIVLVVLGAWYIWSHTKQFRVKPTTTVDEQL